MSLYETENRAGTGTPTSGGTSTTEQAKQEASATAQTAKEGAKHVAGEAGQQAKAVVGEAKGQAQQLVQTTRDEIQQQAQQRTQQASQSLRGMANSITALLEGRPDDAQQIRSYLEQAQTKMQSFADRIEQQGPQGLIDEAARFARRKPGMFLIGAGLAGFAIGRVVRAGAAAASEQSGGGQSGGQMYGGGMYGGQTYAGDYGTTQIGTTWTDSGAIGAGVGDETTMSDWDRASTGVTGVGMPDPLGTGGAEIGLGDPIIERQQTGDQLGGQSGRGGAR